MISFFIKVNERIIQLPVNPENITLATPVDNDSVDIVGVGEIKNIGYRKLTTLSIESFFPYNIASYVKTKGDFKNPDYYITLINSIIDNRQPVRLIISELDINMLVAIDEFDYTYEYGTDDVSYSLELSEYRTHNLKIRTDTGQIIYKNELNNRNIDNVNSNRPIERTTPKLYTVRRGDSLWKIAKRYLGDGNKWRLLYNYANNKSIIGGNPRLIKAGQTLSLP